MFKKTRFYHIQKIKLKTHTMHAFIMKNVLKILLTNSKINKIKVNSIKVCLH